MASAALSGAMSRFFRPLTTRASSLSRVMVRLLVQPVPMRWLVQQ